MAEKPKIKRFILLGDAGAGKSSFINFVYNMCYGTTKSEEIFCDRPLVKLAIPCIHWTGFLDQKYEHNHSERDINDSTQSQTQKCTIYPIKVDNETQMELIDTPGFNDTNGADIDEDNLKEIEERLRKLSYLNGIIIIINGSLPRLGLSFKNFLRLLHQVWPNDLLKNCVAVLTNCDSLSFNLDPSVLQHEFHIDKNRTFYLQNSLFRWNRNPQSTRVIRRFQQDFEESLRTIKTLMLRLSKFNDVSTKSFETGAIYILSIEQYIFDIFQKMIDLINAFESQKVVQDGISGAKDTMDRNKYWDKQREINVIHWVEVPRDRPKSARHLEQNPIPHVNQNYEKPLPSNNYSSENHHEKDHSNHGNPHETNTKHSGVNKSLKENESHSNTERRELCPSSAREGQHDGIPMDDDSRDSNSASTSEHYSQTSKSKSLAETSEQCKKYSNPSNSVDSLPKPPQRGCTHDSHLCNTSYHMHKPTYRPQSARVAVTLPDNEARSRYNDAKNQQANLTHLAHSLIEERKNLEAGIKYLMKQLQEKVSELRSINKNYDILGRTSKQLKHFKEILNRIDDCSSFLRYYDDAIKILSKKS